MAEYIAFDAHKRYTWVDREDHSSGEVHQHRLEHAPGAVRRYLSGCAPGSSVAVEATGNWYWIVDEIEQAGMRALLVHPHKAKLMMGLTNKTDKLDAQGLNRLQRTGTLPTVWIPAGRLRDLRELTRTRVVFVRQRTRLKNRLSATLAKYGVPPSSFSDPYAKGGRAELEKKLQGLPEQTRWVSTQLLRQLDFVDEQVRQLEQRLEQLVEVTPEMQRLMSLPGVGMILAATMALEIGDIGRFLSAERLASYSGTTPRVHASGGKVRFGELRVDVNRYLKWAFAEAANSVALHHRRRPERHVSQLYRRLRLHKGHAKAIGAVARHLAEAAFHVLSREQHYRDPALGRGRTSEV
ncbi:MAG TPA: IS110 family transposase [Candidatus Acidoferrales bacterium]|jgi:transposase|nr:IS110 family transposase [Candidatus Acidoferrales bacterium]